MLSHHENYGRWTFYLNFYPVGSCTLTTNFARLRLWDFLLKNHIVKLSSDGIMKRPRVSRTKKTGERRHEIAPRRSRKKENRARTRVCSLCALLFRYNWKDRAENKGQGQFMAALPLGVGGWGLAAATAQHQRRSRESHYARPAK